MPRRTRKAALPSGITLFILLLVTAYYLYQQASQPAVIQTPVPVAATSQASSAWYHLYFTQPSGDRTCEGPDRYVVAAVEQAQHSIDLAAYSLTLPAMRDALLSAHKRGVVVRIVMESDNADAAVPQDLIRGGIEILGDRREGLMHNKFIVIDEQQVWTGSMNYTATSVCTDNNNLIQILSPELAQDYTTEFNEMFVDDQFGPGSPANTPLPKLTLAGTPVEVYYSPDDGIAARLVRLLSGAQHSIDFLSYSFTSDDLGDALLERARNGVQVRGVFDESQSKSNRGTEYNRFKKAGLDIRLDGNPGLMHHKVFIVDGQTVVFGSYNFSLSAEESNDENLLIIQNTAIATSFTEEFQRVFSQAQP